MSLLHEFNRSVLAIGAAAIILGASAPTTPARAADPSSSAADQNRPAEADAAMRVKTALKSDPTFDARHVDVSIERGDVVLHGFVQSSRALLDAKRIARKAAGDRKVVNDLKIEENPPNAP